MRCFGSRKRVVLVQTWDASPMPVRRPRARDIKHAHHRIFEQDAGAWSGTQGDMEEVCLIAADE